MPVELFNRRADVLSCDLTKRRNGNGGAPENCECGEDAPRMSIKAPELCGELRPCRVAHIRHGRTC
jgi:hypothetical protein